MIETARKNCNILVRIDYPCIFYYLQLNGNIIDISIFPLILWIKQPMKRHVTMNFIDVPQKMWATNCKTNHGLIILSISQSNCKMLQQVFISKNQWLPYMKNEVSYCIIILDGDYDRQIINKNVDIFFFIKVKAL